MSDLDDIKARVDLVQVVGKYVQLKQSGKEWIGLCPFHADSKPSFYVVPDKGFCHCFPCDLNLDVFDFLMRIEGIDLPEAKKRLSNGGWPERPKEKVGKAQPPRQCFPTDHAPVNFYINGLGQPSRTFELRNEKGQLLAIEARYDNEKGKEIRVWTWGARPGQPPQWGVGHWPAPRPLYGLDRLAQRQNAKTLIVEGPKCAEAAQRLLPGMVCMSWTGGANAVLKNDWSPLSGRAVYIWPDADKPGLEAGEKLAALLSDPRGLACEVTLIESPGKPEGWDLADAEGEGWTASDAKQWALQHGRKFVIGSEPAQGESVGTATTDEAPPPPDPNSGNPPSLGSSPPDAPPPAEFPPEASTTRPERARGRDYLRPVPDAGNAVAKPEQAPEGRHDQTSEAGVARYFVSLYENRYRVVHEWASSGHPCWLVWDGVRWLRDKARTDAWQKMEALSESMQDWAAVKGQSAQARKFFSTKKFMGAVLDLCERNAKIVDKPTSFDADPMLLGTPAGVVDLNTGVLRDPLPEDMLTRCTNVVPGEGEHPLFDQVIERASGGDEDIRAYLWRWLGYILSGSVREEAFLFLHGLPGSGKTTLVEALHDILGDTDDGGYAAKIKIELLLQSKHDQSDQLAHCAGARLVHAAETEQNRTWREALIAEFTGGDRMRGRFLYHESFTWKASHKFLVHGNFKPHIKGAGGGISRRLHLIEYPGKIEEIDRSFKQKLMQEYPAILQSMIHAAREWLDVGLGLPESVERNVKDYLESEDTLAAWLQECCERSDPDARTRSSALYESYKVYLQQHGEFVPSNKAFSQQLIARGYQIERTNYRLVRGLALRDAPQRAPIPYAD